MTLMDVLPLIRGWTWRNEERTATLTPGQELLVYQPPTPTKEVGWAAGLDFGGDDAYLGLRLVMPGTDTGYGTFAGTLPWGAVAPPPSGMYLWRYYRPNPMRTIGLYGISLITSAYPYPYWGAVRLYMTLTEDTTEPYATGILGIAQVVITDRNLFLKDLRKVKYGRWATLMDIIGWKPLLKVFGKKFEELDIRFEEKEKVEPPGHAR